jgi:hypothetical protein
MMVFQGGRTAQRVPEGPILITSRNTLLPASEIRDLLFPGDAAWFTQSGNFQIVESIEISGRSVLVVDWTNPDGGRERRLWIDALLGIIFRDQHFGGADYQTIMRERVVTAMDLAPEDFHELADLRAPFPETFHTTARAEPLAAPTGVEGMPELAAALPGAGHEPMTIMHAPEDYDPALYPLRFQYMYSSLEPSHATGEELIAYVFSQNYYLGTIITGDPFSMSCTRSPDRKSIAYASWFPDEGQEGINNGTGTAKVVFVDLADLSKQNTLGQIQSRITSLAFSPDSTRLAFAYRGSSSGITLVNVRSETSASLTRRIQVSRLIWSPDGNMIAWIGYRDDQKDPGWVIQVYSNAERKIVFEAPYDIESGEIPEDSPAWEWGATLLTSDPGGMSGSGMQDCLD